MNGISIFPHVMLRAKAVQFKKGERKLSHKLISNTRIQGQCRQPAGSQQPDQCQQPEQGCAQGDGEGHGPASRAHLPEFHSKTLRKRDKGRSPLQAVVKKAGPTMGKVALFATCYCNVNTPDIGQDLIKVFEHNEIPVRLTDKEACCGMPKLEQGDLETVDKYRKVNIPELVRLIDEGWDLVAAIPSCVLMFKQELPLMYPDDPDVQKVKQHFYDPFEYLVHRHKAGLLKVRLQTGPGKSRLAGPMPSARAEYRS